MPDAAIRVDCLQTFQVTLDLATQIAFDLDLVVRDRVNDFVQLLRRKVFARKFGSILVCSRMRLAVAKPMP